MRILTADEARAFDRWAMEQLGLPPLVLMENAALALADAVGERFPAARRVALFCGPGNNGGDGFALGRQLAARGYEVELFLAAFGRPLANDCARQLEICEALGLDPVELGEDWRPAAVRAAGADLIVDALFGTGLARPLVAPFDALVELLNELGRPCLAVDLPSGLDAGRGSLPGAAVRATATVTFAAPKVAHLLAPAAEQVGELLVADLGVPFDASPVAQGDFHLLVSEELATELVPRRPGAHKGDFGHVLLVAGSRGKAGAAILAARAAVVGGAGLVTVASVESAWPALAAAVPEAMSLALPEEPAGGLAATAGEALFAAALERDVVALGPGLGTAAETAALVRDLVLRIPRPVVLDADGLNAFAGRAAELAGRRAPTLLTPHPGELARLLGETVGELQADRPAAARRAAQLTGSIVVLKGERTIIALPEGRCFLNLTGNPAMASGGSGDVLTGLLAARLAQGDEPALAAQLAVHLHGLAGDLAHAARGGPAVPAGCLVDHLAAAHDRLISA